MYKRMVESMNLRIVLSVLAVAMLTFTGTVSADDLWTQPRIKMIELSWSNPTVPFLAKNIEQIEASCPLDGVTIRFSGRSPNKTIAGSNAMSKNRWEYEWFKNDIELYKTIKFKKLTDNFYYTVVSPGNANWFSDEDWGAVCCNYGIAARIAKETGMRGICFDIEEYGIKFWDYSTIKTGESYGEAYKIARQRGQEWGKAVFGAYPEIAILALHMMSYGNRSTSLTVPFFNGVMSVMPKTATLNDGLESASYHATKSSDYDRMVFLLYRKYLNRVEESNIDIYKTQVKLAPGYYMDGIFPTNKESYWHRILADEIKDKPKSFVRRILMSGTSVADEFIWVYGERGAWWKGTTFPTWEERVPGITDVFLSVKDSSLLDISKFVNLLKNPEFKEKSKNWSFWQIEHEKKNVPVPGKGYFENGALKIEGVTSGCFTQVVAVEPGEAYLLSVTAQYETETSGFCSGNIAFQDKNRKWNNLPLKCGVIFPRGERGKWTTKMISFIVPEDSHYVSVQMGAGSLGKGGKVAFQKIALYKF